MDITVRSADELGLAGAPLIGIDAPRSTRAAHERHQGAVSRAATLAMAHKLLDAAQNRWRRFNRHKLVADVLAGAQLMDGERVTDDENTTTDERVAPDSSRQTPIHNIHDFSRGGYGTAW